MTSTSLAKRPDLALAFALLAGCGDALTGIFLLALPATTLGWMSIETPLSAQVFIRFIGVFVFGVGISYLYPFVLSGHHRERRLATVFEVTACIRSAVALFVTAAVATQALAPAWLTVAVVDGILALVQISWLRKGVFDDLA